ncbi:MAG: ABC transporter substrate-binding protein, partial [Caldimonas sp.]
TDIGPEGLCYNSKLFAAAGLPSDRADVAALFGGTTATWDKFFEVGKQYHDATGKAFYDQSGFVWNAFVNQQKEGYYKKDGSLNVENNSTLKNFWLQLGDAQKAGLSANSAQWDWGKGASFVDGTFAVFVCPGWMLGVVKGNTEAGGGDASTGWDFADVFPGGYANWGGSFLTVPTTSKHPKEAAELAAWLTDTPQEVASFQAAGTFPSVKAAQTDAGVTGTNDLSKFFNDAPVGTILGARAAGVIAQFKGPDDALISDQVFGPPRAALDAGTADGETTWNQAIDLLHQLLG